MTEAERRAQFEEVRDILWVQLRLYWFGVTAQFWRLLPHEHRYTTSQWCVRCWRSDHERFSK